MGLMFFFALLVLLGLAAWMVFGWKAILATRHDPARRFRPLTIGAWSLASASAALFLGSAAKAMLIRPFPYYDPVLLLIYKIGLLLALLALLVSLAQLGHRTRMLASAAGLSLVMLAVWVFQASLE